MSSLVLSLFPGIGLLDMAFELEGFCVVRGPDVLWGGDIRRFHPPAGKFDGVIGGPPCQAFSRLAHMVRHNGYEPKFGNLIPQFARVVIEAGPEWWLMENVPDAPDPDIDCYGVHSFLLNNRQCVDDDGNPATQHRLRKWWFGFRGERKVLMVETAALESLRFDYAACGGSNGRQGPSSQFKHGGKVNSGRLPWNAKTGSAFRTLCELQGLPADFLADAPFTVAAKCKAVGNGVPLPMGRAIAKAVTEAIATEAAR